MAEAIGTLVLGTIGLTAAASFTFLGVSIATVAGSAILLGGAIGLQLLLNRSAPGAAQVGSPALPPPDAMQTPIKQSIGPRIVGLGRNRIAGVYVLFEADPSTNISYDIVALHHGRIHGFVGYYLDDDVVTLGGTGIVDAQGDGRYASNLLTIKTRLGAVPETAYTEVTTPLSTIWTSAHRGDGIASLMLKCTQPATIELFTSVYPRRKPQPSVVADCSPIFDPRDGAQDQDVDSTWVVSSNPVLQLLFVLTDADRGMGLDWDVLIEPVLDRLMAQADLCDVAVDKASGATEPRYTSNGTYALDSDPADILSSILDTGDIWISENGDGALALKVGVFETPSFTLEDRHIRGFTLQKGVADEELVNELTIDYTEPQLDYKTAPGEPWRDETSISELGVVRSQRLALPWVQSHSQARRLAKRRMAQLNAPIRGTLTTTLYGLIGLGERWIKVESSQIDDLANLVIEVRGTTIDLQNAQVTFKFVAVNPNEIDAWDADTEEGTSPTIAAKLVAPAPPVPASVLVTQNGQWEAGEDENPAFLVSFTDPGRSDLTFQASWRVTGSGSPFTNDPVVSPYTSVGGRTYIHGGYGITVAGTYDVKVRSLAPTGPGSSFSSVTTCTLT